jgi:hypothetical protein
MGEYVAKKVLELEPEDAIKHLFCCWQQASL